MEHIARFIEQATVQQLKDKLHELGHPSNGAKAVLKLRLEEAVRQLNEEQIIISFPRNIAEVIDEESSCDNETETTTLNSLQTELENLREMVRVKEEIAELRRKLATLSNVGDSVHNNHPYTFKDIEDSLLVFTGDDNLSVRKWLRSFEEAQELYQWDERRSFLYAQRLLKGTAKLLLRSATCKSWTELKSLLLKEFDHHITAADIHNMLRTRKKQKEESLQQYVLVMQEISALGDISEQDLVNYTIKGIPDSSVNKQLLYSAENIGELKKALRRYEKMKSCNSLETGSQSTTLVTSTTSNMVKRSNPNQQSSGKLKCFNCNNHGHFASNCPKPTREKGSCFKCGKQGHSMRSCTATAPPPLFDGTSRLATKSSVMMVQDQELPLTSPTPGGSEYQILNITNNFFRTFRYTIKSSSGIVTTLEAETMLDTGSPISFVQECFVPQYAISSVDTLSSFHGINGSKLIVVGIVNSMIDLGSKQIELKLFVVETNTMQLPVVLGRDFLEKGNIYLALNEQINYDNNLIVSDNKIGETSKEISAFECDILRIDVDCFGSENMEAKIWNLKSIAIYLYPKSHKLRKS